MRLLPPLAEVPRALARPAPRTLLVLGLAFAILVGSGSSGAGLSSDTAVYATIGREMVERGDGTRLTVDGRPYANKPPLVFWMEAAAFSVLGFTEAAARLPSRLFGLATIALLMALVARTHGRRAAFLAGLAVATWPVFRRSAATARLDSTLAFFSLAVVALFLRVDRRGLTPGRALGLGALAGLAVLAKGPAGLLGPLAIALGAPLAGRGRLALRAAPLAAAGLLLVAGPWYALQLAREGDEFARTLASNLARGGAPTSGLGAALARYGTDVFLQAAWWTIPLLAGIALAARRLRRRPDRSLPEALALSAVAVLLVGIALVRVHYARYFVPAVPFFAWLLAPWLSAALHGARRLPGARRAHVALAAVLAAVVLAGWPLALAAGLFPSQDKYPEHRHAVAHLREAAPDARVLPTWSAKQEEMARTPDDEGEGEGIGSVRAAVRFYFGVSLVPWDPDDPGQPPLVLLRHKEGATAEQDRAAFEAKYRLAPVFRGREVSLYRTR